MPAEVARRIPKMQEGAGATPQPTIDGKKVRGEGALTKVLGGGQLPKDGAVVLNLDALGGISSFKTGDIKADSSNIECDSMAGTCQTRPCCDRENGKTSVNVIGKGDKASNGERRTGLAVPSVEGLRAMGDVQALDVLNESLGKSDVPTNESVVFDPTLKLEGGLTTSSEVTNTGTINVPSWCARCESEKGRC